MKNGKLITIITVIALAFFIFMFRSTLIESIDSSSDQTGKKIKNTKRLSAENKFNEDIKGFFYQLNAIKSSYTPVARNLVLKKNSTYRFYGNGGRGKILNSDGEIIMETDVEKKIFIFNVNLSPDQKKILIYRGGINYDVLDPSSSDLMILPKKPPGANMLGFHSWDWIDESKVLGVAYKMITLPGNQNETSCGCGSPRLAGSVLYIYDLNTQQISAIHIPKNLQKKILSINAIDATGKVQLRIEDHTTHENSILGWFELISKGAVSP